MRPDDDAVATPAIGSQTAQRRQNENGNLSRKAHDPEEHRRAREAIDKPSFGNGLHPGADERNHLAAEEELEIPVAKRADHFAHTRAIGLRIYRNLRDGSSRGHHLKCTTQVRAAGSDFEVSVAVVAVAATVSAAMVAAESRVFLVD